MVGGTILHTNVINFTVHLFSSTPNTADSKRADTEITGLELKNNPKGKIETKYVKALPKWNTHLKSRDVSNKEQQQIYLSQLFWYYEDHNKKKAPTQMSSSN